MNQLENFLADTPEGTGETLAALACAECLTDRVAGGIYELVPVLGLTAQEFLPLFKQCGLTEPRNGGEWNIEPDFRDELIRSDYLSQEKKQTVHRYLLGLTENACPDDEKGKTIPSYLFVEAGRAYHLAGSGNTDAAIRQYNQAMLETTEEDSLNGAQWLARKLRKEQEQTGVIPSGYCGD